MVDPAPSLTFRPAEHRDLPAILACQRAALEQLAATSYADTRLREWAGRLTPEEHYLSITANFFLVAEDPSGVAAFAELDRNDGHIPSLFVHPRASHRGLGTALFRQLEDYAAARGIPELTVSAALPAVPFYERRGFIAEPARLIHFAGELSLPYVPMKKAGLPATPPPLPSVVPSCR